MDSPTACLCNSLSSEDRDGAVGSASIPGRVSCSVVNSDPSLDCLRTGVSTDVLMLEKRVCTVGFSLAALAHSGKLVNGVAEGLVLALSAMPSRTVASLASGLVAT